MTPKASHKGGSARRSLVRATGALLLVAGASTQLVRGTAQDGTVGEIRTLQQTYVELKTETSLERKQLAEAKVFLTEEVDLLEMRIASLRESTALIIEKRGEAAEKRAELEAEKAELDAGTASLEAAIGELEMRARAMIVTLPPPLRDQVAQVARNIPENAEDAAAKKLDLYTRYIQVVGALNYVDNFNDEPFVQPGTVSVPAMGGEVEVTMIYFGAGQAYYVDRDGKHAGRGVPAPEGFTWTPDDDIAPAIKLLEQIHGGGAAATFVQVPVEPNASVDVAK